MFVYLVNIREFIEGVIMKKLIFGMFLLFSFCVAYGCVAYGKEEALGGIL